MKRKVGINIDCINGLSPLQALELIKAQGFDCFFTGEYIVDRGEVEKIKERGEKLGLSYEFIHAPFRKANAMWEESEETDIFMAEIKNAVDNASISSVPRIILHASSGYTPPPITDAGLRRYDQLIEYAQKKKVSVAIENLRVFSYYDTLLKRYQENPFVCYCYDNGHEHCYNFDADHIAVYKSKMQCTHIHDNLGKTSKEPTVNVDLHLIPYDGNYDYAQMIRRMDENGYDGPLVLEVFQESSERYSSMSARQFLETCYERIMKIARLSGNC